MFQRSQDTTRCLLSRLKDDSKKRETKKEAIEIRSIWRSTRPADETVGGNSKGSATSVESKGTRHGTAGALKREMEAMSGMAMECKIHFLENASNVARSGTERSTAKIKEAIRECSWNGYTRNEKQGGSDGTKRH